MNLMARQTRATNSPKVFAALARFLSSDELALVAQEYSRADAHGGNHEVGLTREAGVSFNPRLARIISIIVHDLALRDLTTIRASLFCAVGAGRLAASIGAPQEIPPELQAIVCAVLTSAADNGAASAIRGVIILDTVRHLHQTSLSLAERHDILADADQYLQRALVAEQYPRLATKLTAAIEMQRRLLNNTES